MRVIIQQPPTHEQMRAMLERFRDECTAKKLPRLAADIQEVIDMHERGEKETAFFKLTALSVAYARESGRLRDRDKPIYVDELSAGGSMDLLADCPHEHTDIDHNGLRYCLTCAATVPGGAA
jgi:hypothetical protein